MTLAEFVVELKGRLSNPAVLDSELEIYINAAMRSVLESNYSAEDYIEQVLDTACHQLLIDGKFPEIGSVSAGGVSTSFSSGDPERFRRRIAARREAVWMN